MTNFETLKEKEASINASLSANAQAAVELNDAKRHAAAELATARTRLAQLRAEAASNPKLREELGEQLLTVDHLESLSAEMDRDTEPRLASLATAATALSQQMTEVRRSLERAELSELIAQYEVLLRPAWELSDRIRKQAAICNVPLEREGPLLNRERRVLCGYPLDHTSVRA